MPVTKVNEGSAVVVDPLGPVFISYRQSDGTSLAVALAWALRAAGVPVWHDQTDLPPGDTNQRLAEALASGLSGAILVVTPEIERSRVVREVELPALLALADDPAFTFTIVSAVHEAGDAAALDYSAPDRLLGTPEGTLSAIDQSPVATAAQQAGVARAQARRRLEHLRREVAEVSGELLLDLQTRVPPFAARYDAHLIVRLRPPPAGRRRPHPGGLSDLQGFLSSLPHLVAIAGATSVRIKGGAHLSVACALGAAIPSTLLGSVHVVDTSGSVWHLGGQAPAPGAQPLMGPATPASSHRDRGPVLVYLDLLPQRSDAAFDELKLATDGLFAGVVHLRPLADGLLDPDQAAELVGEAVAAIREFAGAHATSTVHLVLRCPYPVALLLGRSLNTLTVHLYEWENSDETGEPSYVPSVVLRPGTGGSPIHQVTASPVPTEET